MEHEHNFTIVIEWRWIAKVPFSKTAAIQMRSIDDSTGMKATKVMCPCGETKELEV